MLAGRGSGGLTVLIKNPLWASGIITKFRTCRNQNIMWLKIKTKPKPTFLAFCYTRPIYKKHPKTDQEKFFSKLSDDIKSLQNQGEVIIIGDLNSRSKKFGDKTTKESGKLLEKVSQP